MNKSYEVFLLELGSNFYLISIVPHFMLYSASVHHEFFLNLRRGKWILGKANLTSRPPKMKRLIELTLQSNFNYKKKYERNYCIHETFL